MFCVYDSKLSGLKLKLPLAFAKLCRGGIPFYLGERVVYIKIIKKQLFIMSQHVLHLLHCPNHAYVKIGISSVITAVIFCGFQSSHLTLFFKEG